MSDTPVGQPRIDSSKRTWLIASGCAGAVGGVATAIPFVSTFQPSEKAKAAGAPVEVDISALKVGEKVTVEWRGKPVWILKRTPEQLAELPKLDPQLADPLSKRHPDEFTPAYAQNEHRSIKPEVLVVGASAPTWVARRPTSSSVARSPRCPTTGKAASSAPATARPSTWPAASSRTSRHRTTCRCRRTCTCLTRAF